MKLSRIVFVVCFLFLGSAHFLNGQECSFSISGRVIDKTSQLPLEFVNILVQETASGTITDEDGHFVLNNLCRGEYHLNFSHIGCETIPLHVVVNQDTTITVELSHTSEDLSTVLIEGQSSESNAKPSLTISRKRIEDNANKNLSTLLENETGVHLLKNGSSVAKPIIHGLYGNRLTILNNGIAQSGQQWGNDHSPEIDPFAADKIQVIKGAYALEYTGGNLGGLVLVEPKRIPDEPHLHGMVNYTYESNGRGHTINTRLGKRTDALAWRINGTLKKYGDKHTPSYFLTNTGVKEANLSLQLEKSYNDKLFLNLYASTFNTTLGILRGSHVGNLTDLQNAFNRDVPFFTQDSFSYSIHAPKQEVTHNLVKLKAKYFLNENNHIEWTIAGQSNDRKEYDVRRGGRTDKPALSLIQYTFNSDLKYKINAHNGWSYSIGNQFVVTDNTNAPGTGISPLIPNYLLWHTGFYTTASRTYDKIDLQYGVRYDYQQQNAVTFSNDLPRRIVRYNRQYHTGSGVLNIKYKIGLMQNLLFNTGYAMRNPAINELYSSGLHQGVSGIEEGDIDLKTERSIKNSIEYQWIPSANFSVSALAFFQHFRDYIYLNPQDKVRLTIRGAFPVFIYEQTDANIYGLDVSSQFTIDNSFIGNLKYSYLRGNDISLDRPLVFMPPNRLFGSLTYRSKLPLKMSNRIRLNESELEVNFRHVFEQKHLNSDQDFLAPPTAYSLLGAQASTNILMGELTLRCFLRVENLLDTSYRDYLNRQRYFADDNGRSFVLGLNLKF